MDIIQANKMTLLLKSIEKNILEAITEMTGECVRYLQENQGEKRN